jgi:poly(hydroxyalkanoate) depolymerase family esterase
VALHGCTQTARDFAAGTRFDRVAERAGAFVLYPEQSLRANPHRCWNWFMPENQHRETGEPAAILTLIEHVVAQHAIDRGRIFVAGLSAGGAMAAILAEQAPDVFAAVGIVAGVALHATRDAQSAYAAMAGEHHALVTTADIAPILSHLNVPAPSPGRARLRATIWSGTDDRTVSPKNATLLARQFATLLGLGAATPEAELRDGASVDVWRDARGRARIESWTVPALGHAWSGGSLRGSYTHPRGPDASQEMMAFFLERDGRLEPNKAKHATL